MSKQDARLADAPRELESLRRRIESLEARLAEKEAALEALEEKDRELSARVEERSKQFEKGEQLFRALTESMHASVLIASVTEQRYIYANPAAVQCTGYSFEELTAGPSVHILTEESARFVAKAGEAYLRGDQVQRHFELDIRKKNGDTCIWETSWAVIDLPGQGMFTVIVGFDISKRKEIEASLKTSEERYRTIFNTATTAMVLSGDDKVIHLANDEWVKLSGYTREETEGKLTWMPFFTEESLVKMLQYHELRSRHSAQVPSTYEVQFVSRSGEIHDGVLNISLIPGTSERVASFLNVTELKKAEKQMYRADKMAALGQIIAGVAHEINNPNNFIYFNLPILKRYIEAMRPMLEHHLEDDPDLTVLNMPYQVFLDDVYRLIDNMAHGSKRITGIVSELKNYVRSDDAKQFSDARIDDVIERMMALIGKQVQKMVKRFEVKTAPDLPLLKMNPGKMEQVLINLVINAGQAACRDDAYVSIDTRLGASGKTVEIRVEDNGEGIPIDIQQKIFEPFFTTKSRDAGTGLGLSISHRIVEEHGGTLTVESRVGEGTCFTIGLPIPT